MEENIEVPKFSKYMEGIEVVPGQGRVIQEQPDVSPMKALHLQESIDRQNEAYNEQQQALANMPQEQNPFAVSQYGGGMPDAPISYGGGMAEQLLNDNEVPEKLRIKFWNVFHKDNTLTFLDEKRKMSKLLNFDIMKIDMLNAMPYYDYTFEKELEFGIMRGVYETKLDRALGIKGGNIKNERTMLQSQFHETRQINEGNMGQGNIKEGFFKRLLGRR